MRHIVPGIPTAFKAPVSVMTRSTSREHKGRKCITEVWSQKFEPLYRLSESLMHFELDSNPKFGMGLGLVVAKFSAVEVPLRLLNYEAI
jgi:hypothetical protein